MTQIGRHNWCKTSPSFKRWVKLRCRLQSLWVGISASRQDIKHHAVRTESHLAAIRLLFLSWLLFLRSSQFLTGVEWGRSGVVKHLGKLIGVHRQVHLLLELHLLPLSLDCLLALNVLHCLLEEESGVLACLLTSSISGYRLIILRLFLFLHCDRLGIHCWGLKYRLRLLIIFDLVLVFGQVSKLLSFLAWFFEFRSDFGSDFQIRLGNNRRCLNNARAVTNRLHVLKTLIIWKIADASCGILSWLLKALIIIALWLDIWASVGGRAIFLLHDWLLFIRRWFLMPSFTLLASSALFSLFQNTWSWVIRWNRIISTLTLFCLACNSCP